MANLTTRQSSADAAAMRAAREAEEARKREIMKKIRVLEQEKTECQELKSAFAGAKECLAGLISQMNGLKATKLEADIYRFSGAAAEAVSTGMSEAQLVMEKRSRSLSNVETATGMQIGLLSSYIAELEGQINILRAGL